VERAKYDFCVATANLNLKRQVIAALAAAGFQPAGTAASIPDLLRLLRTIQPWLAVVDTAVPPGNLAQLASIIEEDSLAAAVYVGTSGPPLTHYVMLPWPVEAPVLAAVAEAVCLEFARKKKLYREIASLKEKLTARREIEKAKGLLMQKLSLTEEEAFQRLRSHSMQQRLSLIETARQIILDPDAVPFR
jgi:response regulator NasT